MKYACVIKTFALDYY